MGEQPGAQIAERPLSARGGEIAVQKGHRLHGGHGEQVEQREGQQAMGVPDGEMAIDDRANDERRGELEGRRGQHQEPDHDHPGSLPRQQTQQTLAHRRAGIRGARAARREAGHRRACAIGDDSATRCAR